MSMSSHCLVLDSATYDRPGENSLLPMFTTILSLVSPWTVCTVQPHASDRGTCSRVHAVLPTLKERTSGITGKEPSSKTGPV